MKSQSRSAKLSDLRKALGPGILLACAAIRARISSGPRALAQFGWSLLWFVLLANVLRFPFSLIGHRYTSATGESLLCPVVLR